MVCYNNYDIDKFSNTVNKVIKDNNLKGIYEVFLYVDDCKDDEYIVSCSYIKSVYKRVTTYKKAFIVKAFLISYHLLLFLFLYLVVS